MKLTFKWEYMHIESQLVRNFSTTDSVLRNINLGCFFSTDLSISSFSRDLSILLKKEKFLFKKYSKLDFLSAAFEIYSCSYWKYLLSGVFHFIHEHNH